MPLKVDIKILSGKRELNTQFEALYSVQPKLNLLYTNRI